MSIFKDIFGGIIASNYDKKHHPLSYTHFSPEETKDREVEDVFYIEVEDPVAMINQLGIEDTLEHHDQWEIKAEGHRTRVRMTVKGEDSSYVMTKKEGDYEYNEDITEFVFECFKGSAPGGMVKDRFTLPIKNLPGLKFEFDLFIKPEGGYYPWVKIDIELPEYPIKEKIEIPKVYKTILSDGKKEDKELISTLYDTMFITKGNSKLLPL